MLWCISFRASTLFVLYSSILDLHKIKIYHMIISKANRYEWMITYFPNFGLSIWNLFYFIICFYMARNLILLTSNLFVVIIKRSLNLKTNVMPPLLYIIEEYTNKKCVYGLHMYCAIFRALSLSFLCSKITSPPAASHPPLGMKEFQFLLLFQW